MTNFFEVECSINDNNSTLEIIQYEHNELVIQEGTVLLPADFVNIIDEELINFLNAGSGIHLSTSPTGVLISVSGLNSSYIDDLNEAIDDRIGDGLLVAGNGININYDDDLNQITISSSLPSYQDTYASLTGANFTGNISAPQISGNSAYFNNMVYINGVAVSISGHSHIIPDVSNLENTLNFKLDLDDNIEGGFF